MVIIPAAISLLQSLISSIPLFKLRPSACNRYRSSDYPCSTPFTGISLKASLSCSMVIIPAAISLLQSLISSIPLFKLRPSACNRYRSSDYPCSTPFTGISLKASLSCSMVIIPAAISLLQSLISSIPLFKLRPSACNRYRYSDYPCSTPFTGISLKTSLSCSMMIIPAAISLLQSLISSIPLFKLRPLACNRYRSSDYPCSTPFTGISLKASLSCLIVIIPAAISLLQSLISSIPLFKLRPSACNRYRSSDYPCSTPFTGISLKASLSCSMVIIPAAISLLQSLISSIPLFKLRPSACNRYRYSDYPCSTPFTGISLKASLSCSMMIIPAAISLLQSLISSIPLFKLRPSACNRYRSSDYPCSTPFTGISLKASLSCLVVIIPAAISLLQSLISSIPLFKLRPSACNIDTSFYRYITKSFTLLFNGDHPCCHLITPVTYLLHTSV